MFRIRDWDFQECKRNSLYLSGGGINKDMRDFLSQDFPNSDEVDIDLQDATRDNLYARTVPCTYSPCLCKKLETKLITLFAH